MANFSQQQIEQVWQKAIKAPNNDPNVFRQDYAGAWIRKDQYGRRDKKYGWEIDHCRPESKGGSDNIDNLYPLHWKNNNSKGNDYPNWKTVESSIDNRNIEEEKYWHI